MNEEEEILECADCGAILNDGDPNHENDEGERICEDCAGNYATCADCNEIVSREGEYRDENGDLVCESCAEHYFTCADCDRTIHGDNGTWIAGLDALVCNSCLDERYFRCEDCGRYVSDDDSYGLGSGGRICNTCYERGDYIFAEHPTQGSLILRKIIGEITVKEVIFPGKERGYAKLSFRFDPRRLLSVVYEDDALLTSDGHSSIEDVILDVGGPTKMELLMPQIHEWREEGVPWLEIHRRTGLSASCAGVYYHRWRKALAEAEEAQQDTVKTMPTLRNEPSI